MLQILEGPAVHFVMPAYFDLPERLYVLNKTFDKPMVNVNQIKEHVRRFEIWLDNFAQHKMSTTGQDSVTRQLLRAWLRNDTPAGSDANASSFEKALKKMKRNLLRQHGQPDVRKLGVDYKLSDSTIRAIYMPWNDNMVIQEAALILKKQFSR